MNIFTEAYRIFVYQPQLNLLQLIFDYVGDTGLSIIILALIVNLLMLPLYISAYINGQKVKLLQPMMKDLREKFKNDQQKYVQEMIAFNKRHGVSNGSTFLTLIVQIFFVSGLYIIVRDVVDEKNFDKYLYPFVKDLNVEFTTKAFDFLTIDSAASEHIWLPFLAALFMFLYGFYMSKLAPKTKLKAKPKKPKAQKTDTPESLFDPEAFQKSMEFNSTFLIPVIYFTFNMTMSVGVNLYLVTSTFVSLIRHIFITQYYKGHIKKLAQRIEDSDPIFKDGDPSNDYDILDITEKPKKKKKKKNSKSAKSQKKKR